MATNQNAAPGFASLASVLEQALEDVKTAKQAHDLAKNKEADAHNAFQSAVKGVQKAKSEYDAHVNEAMSGFAQIHQ